MTSRAEQTSLFARAADSCTAADEVQGETGGYQPLGQPGQLEGDNLGGYG